MAALASSTGSLHKDIRSESRGYKRDKDHSTKWIVGSRPLPGVKRNVFSLEPTTEPLELPTKVRPEKKASDQSSFHKLHSNSLRNSHMGHASSRIARKADARAEVSSPNTLSRSLAELAPHNSPAQQARTPALDSGVLYSFDAKASPRRGVGLDALVEKAERDWSNKETVKLVKNEYEILDGEGEVTIVKAGKKGKKNSPKQRPQLITADEEDDWERI